MTGHARTSKRRCRSAGRSVPGHARATKRGRLSARQGDCRRCTRDRFDDCSSAGLVRQAAECLRRRGAHILSRHSGKTALRKKRLLAGNVQRVQLIPKSAIGGETLNKVKSLFAGHLAPPATGLPI
ncbi:hypothetical protein J2848_005388 [Azospirillum lipoferum]|uniref:hypothetical protein n=1 Tax=Azospirillum lipoferum TaxID=193 RepID=UPI00147869E6|nr:hypothetical protein [Azospirillum lipoferum]MCP1613691.1 hypothetical protein [Azospirillum lipoferum]